MKIVSWNVNGLRASVKKGFIDWLHSQDADVVGLQEIKADESQLPEEVLRPHGARGSWHAFFSPCRIRKGYSGVALFLKDMPDRVDYGFGIPRFDDEGRYIAAYIKDIVVINCYFPNGGGGPERLSYKYDFYDEFLKHVLNLRKNGYKVVFIGDVNTAHSEIDLARPKENEKNTGFLPDERAWLDEVIRNGFIDSFRHLHPSQPNMYSYWDMKTRARDRNVGWRIDYCFISNDLLPTLSTAGIDSEVLGSDHCPVWVKLK